MSDPRDTRTSSGFIARVRDDVGADLCHEFSAKTVAEGAAREFVATYPDGEFEMPDDRERHAGGPIDWRDE